MSTRVLIVEDNPVARNFLMRVVRDSFSDEIAFTEASDLASARRAFAPSADEPETAPFALILCDLEVDDGSGLELLSELSRHPATKIATTLHSDDEHLFPALQCGANGYLLKEDRFEVLVEELQKIVRGQPPLSPAIARRLLGFFRQAETSALPAEVQALSPREQEVLTHLSKGFTFKEVARALNIQWFAINDHIRAVYAKLAEASLATGAISATTLPPGHDDTGPISRPMGVPSAH